VQIRKESNGLDFIQMEQKENEAPKERSEFQK
jgi:hypothetical protein